MAGRRPCRARGAYAGTNPHPRLGGDFEAIHVHGTLMGADGAMWFLVYLGDGILLIDILGML